MRRKKIVVNVTSAGGEQLARFDLPLYDNPDRPLGMFGAAQIGREISKVAGDQLKMVRP